MDNRVFNVNGETKPMLRTALQLALWQRGGGEERATAAGYTFDPQAGLLLLWHVDESKPNQHKFMAPMTADALVDQVWTWLQTEEAKSIPLYGQFDIYDDCDVTNEPGWRVYCNDWGHVANNCYAIVAVTPAYLWYGK